MSYFRYYLSYPTSPTTYSDEVEITEFVIEGGSSDLSQTLSNDEYDIGTLKFNKLNLELVNQNSIFSEAINQFSIFTYKRDESILRITWQVNPYGTACGSTPCGYAYLSHPVEVYRGLLEENSSKFDEKKQTQMFTFLGLESIIKKTQTPYGSLSVSDDAETLIYKILNQEKITRIMTVEQSNINVNFNFTPNDITSLQNTESLTAINDLLFLSGSILYVEGTTIIVKSRDIGAISVATFYGKASDRGIESIINIEGLTTGVNRTFNFWKWGNTGVTASFTDSIERNGFRLKSVDSDLVTNTGLQNSIINSGITEFGFPKREMVITVPLTTPHLKDIFLLDKINLDIPIETDETEDGSLPARYSQAFYGEARYIQTISSLIVSLDTNWKILNRSVSLRNKILKFRIREE